MLEANLEVAIIFLRKIAFTHKAVSRSGLKIAENSVRRRRDVVSKNFVRPISCHGIGLGSGPGLDGSPAVNCD